MASPDSLSPLHQQMIGWRHDIHRHPELAYGEVRTAGMVAELLRSFGFDQVTEGIGGTGVVGELTGTLEGPADALPPLGFRADMDALPIQEDNSFDHRSRHDGIMHACGHDGHTAMLLGAARHLSATRQFAGKLVFIFQPAEEGKAGAKAMIQDGLFDRWPVRGVFGLHNMPGLPEGAIAVSGGPVMAAADEIIVRITGRGGHAAAPDQGRDPILAGASFVQSCQQIVARNVAPWDTGVVSITVFQGGDTFNVTPEQAQLDGTVRFFRPETGAMIRDRLDAIRKGIALAHDVDIELDYLPGYPPTVNDKAAAETAKAAAAAALGAGRALVQDPRMFAEDFSYMLQACPGAYGFIGNGTSRSLHSACYDFNDKILPNGAAWFVTLAETIPTSRP